MLIVTFEKKNKEKLTFKNKSVRYFEHLITDSDLMLDPEKVKAAKEMKSPGCVKKL